MSTKVFVYIWEYRVKQKSLEEFAVVYGPDGDWVKLFRKSDGYLKTELHQDLTNPVRYITIDYWKSKSERDQFRDQFSEEFELLDRHCENFTDSEIQIGEFECISDSF